MATFTKQELAELLRDALARLYDRLGKDTFHAAPLAVEITEGIQRRTGNRNLVLGPEIYESVLFPKDHFADGNGPKFRDFLRQFPDQVELIERYNGDLVRWLNAPQTSVDIKEWKALAQKIIEAETAGTHTDSISCSKLAIQLKRRAPNFDQRKVGFESFHDLLKSWPDVLEFTTVLGGGRVRLRDTKPILSRETLPPRLEAAKEPGYLLVDGEDLRQRLHDLVGAKPAPTQFPDWTKVPAWIQGKFPIGELKCRYFMASGPTMSPTMGPFVHFLEQINFMVRSTSVLLGPDQETNRLRRSQQVSAELTKMLEALVPIKASIFVVSHRPDIAPVLRVLMKTHPDRIVAILGFWEFFPQEYKDLVAEGLRILDLGHDLHCIPDPLPRKISGMAPDFNPAEFL
jgi:hypothetical protein